MRKIPDLAHDIFNDLNTVTILSGVMRSCLREKKYKISGDTSQMEDALGKIELSAVKAAGKLEELRAILRKRKGYV